MGWSGVYFPGEASALVDNAFMLRENRDLTLHIGYHKTGTTFLQRRILPKVCDNALIATDVSYVAESEAYDPDAFVDDLCRQGLDANGGKTVVSQEVLSGRGDGNPIWDPLRIRARLAETFSQAKVLIVVRNQFDYVLSPYAYRVVIRGLERRSLDGFLEKRFEWLKRILRYDRLVARYQGQFGRERVLVLPYELLRREPGRFVDQILGFMESKAEIRYDAGRVNPGTRSAAMVKANRALNAPIAIALERSRRAGWLSQDRLVRLSNVHYYVKRRLINPWLRPVAGQWQARIALEPDWRARMQPVFTESNRRLMRLVEQDLEQYAYPC